MRKPSFPSEEELRSLLLKSAERFHRLTNMPRSEIGHQALNDPAFLTQVEEGRNFRVRTFDTFMRWLIDHWPIQHCTAVENGDRHDPRE